jgi:formamidopyrimidine-DNA glycosylase
MGPEPLTRSFAGITLFQRSRGRSVAIKQFIMDSRIVAGVGNIYANEALFRADIRPDRAAGSLSLAEHRQLAVAIKKVLLQAIDQGGTTLRDFRASDGRPGYFQIKLQVYDRGGDPCVKCGAPLLQSRLGQRSTFFCGHCQK